MNKNLLYLALVLLISCLLLVSCIEAQEAPVAPNTTSEIAEGSKAELDAIEETPNEKADHNQNEIHIRFTIEADENLKNAITLLYQTYFTGETPAFVVSEGELIATQSYECKNPRPCVRSTFLPDSVLIKMSEVPDIDGFIAFAISTEGQEVLINAGELYRVVKIKDQAGNAAEITQPINRVISTNGSATSFIYSLQAQNRLVSASYLGARDPIGSAVMEKLDPRFPEIMGDEYFSQSDFNVEQAATLNPELIIASARTAWLDTVDQLGIEVFLFDAETPARLKDAMRLTGKIFGPNSEALAESWIAYYEQVVSLIQDQVAAIPEDQRPRVLFTGSEPLRVASGDMYQTDIIQAAGGISVSTELNGYWNDVDLEQVALWNPDVIIVPPYGGATVDAIIQNAEWQILDAVQGGYVYQMPKLVVPWDTPAPDSVLGIVWMAQLINSESLELDCASEADYFYNSFYNYPITTEEISSVCVFE